MVLTWNTFRRLDGSIDLVAAFRTRNTGNSPTVLRAIDFLAEVEDMCLIHSAQSAAIAIAHAVDIATHTR